MSNNLSTDVEFLTVAYNNLSQFTLSVFERYPKSLRTVHVTIHTNTQNDDHTESYFGRLKDDYLYIREFITDDEFKSSIKIEDFRKNWNEKTDFEV